MSQNKKTEMESLRQCVQQKFVEIRAALHMREKLLLRQIDVIATSQTNSAKDVQFLSEQEQELFTSIRSFGRFQLDNINLALQDIYLKNEDYITPDNDHETMYKCLQQNGENKTLLQSAAAEEEPEAIVVDFSKNKSLIEHNAKNINESIINITLQEAKALIRNAKVKRETIIPPLNLEELDDELESSIAEAVSTLGHESPTGNAKYAQTCSDTKKIKTKRFKPKITINNCNGTINLRNISSLTINCANEDTITAEIPLQTEQRSEEELIEKRACRNAKQATRENANETSSAENSTPTTTASSSNYSSNSSSRAQSKKQKHAKKSQQHKNGSAVANSNTTTTTTTQENSSAAYPYEVISNDYADVDIVDANNDVDDEAANIATCDFYNRLLNEIKNSINDKNKRRIDNTHYVLSNSSSTMPGMKTAAAADVNNYDANSNTATTSTTITPPPTTTGKRLILKNFENLKIILEAQSGDEDGTLHPVQIEQWLAEIISETDLEPMQNTDILEHSKIHNESV